MDYEFITAPGPLQEFCRRIEDASLIAFDTEFVSEDRYQPELCLIQIAAKGLCAVVDCLAVTDLTPFWNLLTEGNRRTVVHAGREEFRFCWHQTSQRPKNLFDVQIAHVDGQAHV